MRAAQHRCPPGSSPRSTRSCARTAPATASTRCSTSWRASAHEAGSPPLAAPIGQILASQALINVLAASATRRSSTSCASSLAGRFGAHAGPDRRGGPARRRARRRATAAAEHEVDLDELRERAAGLAASEEELLLLALFGEEAEPLLRAIRGRGRRRRRSPRGGVDQARAERIRELVRIVQESGVGEITIEEGGMRVTVRRTRGAPAAPAVAPPAAAPASAEPPSRPRRAPTASCGSRRRWSAPSTAPPKPGAPPFVEEGDAVAPGQTLCILEAMKLMNEIKAEVEGDRPRRSTSRTREPVEYGQLLFELEPVDGRPLDALMFARVLVANRGEIAVRVIRALHELGVEAVAVYSTADADALHVRLADRAVRIGPPPAAESYLASRRSIAAAETTGCEAVHPGLRLPRREPGVRRGVRRERPRLRRAAAPT